MEITDDILKEIAWIDFSIQMDTDQNCFLILICKEDRAKNGLYNFLSNASHSIYFEIRDGIYHLHLQFLHAKSALSYNTKFDEKGYPRLTWLKKSRVKFVTTGTYIVGSSSIDYYKPLLPFYSQSL